MFRKLLRLKEPEPKPRLVCVLLHVDDYHGDKKLLQIPVPEGYTFTNNYAEDPTLYRPDGRISRQIDIKPGYGVLFEYCYEDEDGNPVKED